MATNEQEKNALTGNIFSDLDYTQGYAIIGDSIFDDYRLEFGEFYLLCKLIKLSKTKFYISQRKSCQYFRMSPKTFQKHFSRLIELGYIERQRHANGFTYRIRRAEIIDKLVFNYKKLKNGDYSIDDLKRFLEDKELDPRFRPIVQRYYNALQEPFKEMVEQVQAIEKNDDDMPF